MNNSYKKAMDKVELSDELKEKIIKNASKPQKNQISKFRPGTLIRIAGLAACFAFCVLSYYAVTNYNLPTPANIVSVDTPKPSPNHAVSSGELAADEPVQEPPSLNAVSDSETDAASSHSEESTIAKPPAYETKAEVRDEQIETVSPKQDVAIEDNESAAGNGLPFFAKGKTAAEDNIDKAVSALLTMEQAEAELGWEIKSPQKIPAGYEVSNISVLQGAVAQITYQNENDMITYRTAKSSEDVSQKNDTYEFMEIVNVRNRDIVLKGRAELYYNAVWSDYAESFSITSANGVEKSVLIDMVSSVDGIE